MQTLCKWELLVYVTIWISANFYSLFKLYDAQNEILKGNELEGLVPGWSIIKRYQDVSDIEWSTWKFFTALSWHYLLFQFTVSETVRSIKPSMLSHWYLMSSILFIFVFLGTKHLFFITAEPILYSLALFCGGRKATLWLLSIFLLITYNSFKYKEWVWTLFDNGNLEVDEEVYMLIFAIGWVQLRCISFCFDYVDKKDRHAIEKFTHTEESLCQELVKLFSYALYLPLINTGPLILYSDFEISLTKRNDFKLRIKSFIMNFTLLCIYRLLLDLAMHYIYFLAMHENVELIRKLPTMALCGSGLWMGVQFHMKYVISYGTSGVYAVLDNIDVPPVPRCIARVHVYSQMWRYFDVGLYRFILKYIYKPCLLLLSPLGKFLPKSIVKLLASSTTFLFIFMWHGTTWAILVWTVLNFLGISLEEFARVISGTKQYKNFTQTILQTESMHQRFKAMLCTPLLALSAISNFYLFAGYDVGNVFFESLFQPSFLNSIIVLVSLYSCCHVSMALENVNSRSVAIKKASVTKKKYSPEIVSPVSNNVSCRHLLNSKH